MSSMTKPVLVAGGGRVGSLVAFLLAGCGDYQVQLIDNHIDEIEMPFQCANLKLSALDVSDDKAIDNFLNNNPVQAIISCLPYFYHGKLANFAKKYSTHYFDLTEDVKTTELIEQLAKDVTTAFVPDCGLAPGFVNIVAEHLMKDFDELDTVKLRVGCLPLITDNALQYALAWSTDGLINEYGNVCLAIQDWKKVELQPLENIEEVELDGTAYEAFNTSGGVGTLVESYLGKVKNLNYKTLRYPGHCAKMRFLMKDLKLNEAREELKCILENALPKITQDVVIVYVAVQGQKHHRFTEEVYVNKLYPKNLFNKMWSSIQVTTASGVCAVVDLVFKNPERYHGLILQEQFKWHEFLDNRFGSIFKK
jgi:saccharopine dehydrogenase-like NADP-dependent oxidoreductase